MNPNFTNADLEQMLEECIAELKSLGYEVLPITSIKFTKRKARHLYGFCKPSKYCYFNYSKWEWEGDINVYIRITGNLAYTPIEYKQNLKTLVMHETIHAVKSNEKNTKKPVIPTFDTPHGERFDAIKKRVESELGYKNIDGSTACGLRPVLENINKMFG